jgi:hypothetical protein
MATQKVITLPSPAQLSRRRSLAVANPGGINVYAFFVMAARLAGEAIEVATALQQIPDSDPSEFEDTLHFWHRVRDFNGTAALICAGGTENRAETLVAAKFRSFREKRAPNGQ